MIDGSKGVDLAILVVAFYARRAIDGLVVDDGYILDNEYGQNTKCWYRSIEIVWTDAERTQEGGATVYQVVDHRQFLPAFPK